MLEDLIVQREIAWNAHAVAERIERMADAAMLVPILLSVIFSNYHPALSIVFSIIAIGLMVVSWFRYMITRDTRKLYEVAGDDVRREVVRIVHGSYQSHLNGHCEDQVSN